MKALNLMPRLTSSFSFLSRERVGSDVHSDRDEHNNGAGLRDRIHNLGDRLSQWLTVDRELRVWQDVDPKGNLFWSAYDPVSDRIYTTSSESEMRAWIEQRHYS